MADENTDTNTDDTTTSERPPVVSRTAYEKALNEKRSAAAKAAEYEGRLAEYEAAEQQRKDEAARKAEDWGKLEEGYQSKLQEANAQLQEREAKLTAIERAQRRGVFADAIVEAAGVSNRTAVMKLLPALGLEDDAPEEYGKAEIANAIKALEGVVPELFVSDSTTRKPPPGGGRMPDRDSPEYWKGLAQQDSKRGPMTAYEAAKGPQR